jgi:SAM-dependent methyltransferase
LSRSAARDPAWLRATQYRTSVNLDARIALHQRYSTNPRGWYAWMFDQLTLPAGARVLELGGGTGALWAHNAHRVSAAWQILLSDLSPGMLTAAATAPVAARLAADAQAIPLADAIVDAVLANHMLYHVPDRHRSLGEIHRILRPGGRLYAATNGAGHLRELRELLGAAPVTADVETGFSLETGPEQLARWFRDVEVRRYPDHLEVTDVEPVVAYARSLTGLATPDPALLDHLAAVVADSIRTTGAFHISKDTGLLRTRR